MIETELDIRRISITPSRRLHKLIEKPSIRCILLQQFSIIKRYINLTCRFPFAIYIKLVYKVIQSQLKVFPLRRVQVCTFINANIQTVLLHVIEKLSFIHIFINNNIVIQKHFLISNFLIAVCWVYNKKGGRLLGISFVIAFLFSFH